MRWFFLFPFISLFISCQTEADRRLSELEKKLDDFSKKLEKQNERLAQLEPLEAKKDSVVDVYQTYIDELIRRTGGYTSDSSLVGLLDSTEAEKFFFTELEGARADSLEMITEAYYAKAIAYARGNDSLILK